MEWTDYYSSTTAGTLTSTSGGVAGYFKDAAVSKGVTGTKYYQNFTDYVKHTVGTNDFFFTAHSTAFPQDVTSSPSTASTGAHTTVNTYTWYSGTNLVEAMTTDMPVVSTANNGPNSADESKVFNDSFGRTIWTMDADGYINYTAYDQSTGAVIKTITDVNYASLSGGEQTSLTATGWSYHGSGLNLVTTNEVDSMGRTTKMTDPLGNVSYTVYDDVHHAVFNFRGATQTLDGSGNGTMVTTGPITMSHDQIGYQYTSGTVTLGGTYSEMLAFSGTVTVTSHQIVLPGFTGRGTTSDYALFNLVGNGSTGSPQYTLQSLSRSLTNAGSQMVESDAYFNTDNGTTSGYLSTAANSPYAGSAGTNFYATKYAYNMQGKLAETISPTQTITVRPTMIWAGSWAPMSAPTTSPARISTAWVGPTGKILFTALNPTPTRSPPAPT